MPPGASVAIVNKDGTPNTVTSEAAAASFTPAAVHGVAFDTGSFTGTATITIPASGGPR